MTAAQIAALFASAAGAGAMNAMAGGGTILTFPTLLFLGEPAITANATSAVALWPGSAASLYGYREEVRAHRDWLGKLLLPSLLGGALGAVLLLRTPARTFERLAPFLVLFATLLFAVQGAISRGSGAPGTVTPGRLAAAWIVQFFVAVYGGYFGAGVSILMLAVLGFLGVADIHAANGLKNFFVLVHQRRCGDLVHRSAGGALAFSARAHRGRRSSEATRARDSAGRSPGTPRRRTVVGIGIAVVVALFLMR